jgi:hypothetical protein
MKIHTIIVVALLAVACASGTDTSSPVNARISGVHINGDMRFAGPVAVEFTVEVTNPTTETVMLRKVEIRTAAAGAFSMHVSMPYDRAVKSGETITVDIHADGTSAGGRFAADEPVTFRGNAYFDAPKGTFTKVFQEVLRVQ